MVLQGEALALHHAMDFIHNGAELGVLAVQSVDRVHGGVEVLDVLGVHLEEGGIFHHNVSNPLILRVTVPFLHPFFELENSNEMTGEYFSNQLVRFSHRKWEGGKEGMRGEERGEVSSEGKQ